MSVPIKNSRSFDAGFTGIVIPPSSPVVAPPPSSLLGYSLGFKGDGVYGRKHPRLSEDFFQMQVCVTLSERAGQRDYSRRGDRKWGCWEDRWYTHSRCCCTSLTLFPSMGYSYCTAAVQNELCKIQLSSSGCESMKSGCIACEGCSCTEGVVRTHYLLAQV